jgi:hypothetical protein
MLARCDDINDMKACCETDGIGLAGHGVVWRSRCHTEWARAVARWTAESVGVLMWSGWEAGAP